jgi:hypothetical protein
MPSARTRCTLVRIASTPTAAAVPAAPVPVPPALASSPLSDAESLLQAAQAPAAEPLELSNGRGGTHHVC